MSAMDSEKKFFIVHGIVLTLFCLVGCTATDLSMRASLVKLTTVEQAHILEYECQYLGSVVGASYWYQFESQDVGHNNALNELLDNAAELGATHVFVNRGNYHDLRGEAYYCAYCRLADGKADVSRCLHEEKEISGLDRLNCVKKRYHWHMRALDEQTCIERGGTWLPDRDVLRILPIPLAGSNQKK